MGKPRAVCTHWSFEKCLLEHRVGIPARKATVEEIIEHFKKREK